MMSPVSSSLFPHAGVRPVPLEIHIQGFEIANFEARMQAMARPAYAAINSYACGVEGGKPALVFVPTRKHARLVALDLLTFAAADGTPHKFLQVSRPSYPPACVERPAQLTTFGVACPVDHVSPNTMAVAMRPSCAGAPGVYSGQALAPLAGAVVH